MRLSHVLMTVVATALVSAGCAGKKEPATNAVQSAETALAEIRMDAVKYAPTELQTAEASLAAQKQRLANEKYQDVIEAQPKFAAEVSSLREIVISKQTQLAAATLEWQRLSKEVPSMIMSIENQVAALTGKRLPQDVTKDEFESAKQSLATMKSTWAEATAAFDAGNAAEAADKGRVVEAKGDEIGAQLGMSTG